MVGLREVSWRHAGAVDLALDGVTLEARAGERVLICGRSGSGKSTLLAVVSGTARGERVAGEVRWAGTAPETVRPRDRARYIGFVGQDPADQLVAGSIDDEVAFGPEGQALARDEVAARVAGALEQVGLGLARDRDPAALSGGQQQRVVVAAAMSGGAGLLALDEPLARLDADGADRLLAALAALAAEGACVLLVEHRLERCLPWADRVIVLDRGRVVADGPPDPEVVACAGLLVDAAPRALPEPGDVLARWDAVTVERGGRRVLAPTTVVLRSRERVAVVGPNGAGKSTLLGVLSGRLGPARADLRVLEVPQDADLALFCDTVGDELAYGPREARLSEVEVARRVDAVAGPLGLVPLLGRPPQALSSGERLRVAVGAALTCGADVLLLDEPTAGQDAPSVAGLLEAIDRAAPEAAVVFATHDLRLVAREAHTVIRLDGGDVGVPAPPGTRPATGLDPRARLALVASVGLLAVLLDRPAALGLLAAVSGAMLLALPVGARWRWRALGLAAALVWSTALSQGLFYGELPRTPWFRVGPIQLWREGVQHGVAQSLRMLATAFAGLALAVSTPTDRLVAALGALRVPWAVGLLASVALRSVPDVADAWLVVRRARSARGRPLWARSPWAWLVLETRLLRPVAARALRRARALARSLDARGFDPEAPRTLHRPLVFRWWDAAVVAGATGVVGSVLALEMLYGAYLAEVLYVPALRPLYGWVRAWL